MGEVNIIYMILMWIIFEALLSWWFMKMNLFYLKQYTPKKFCISISATAFDLCDSESTIKFS